ncbi:alpha/beta fold hydrolase [Streptomyces sp. NPDC058657]|uniref:alpha/beta fold hydrolase n=1 Tax=unclassified Streptomyces TaxID=2593676 RepID=UPI003669E19C
MAPPPVEVPRAEWEDCPITGQPTRECTTLKVPVDAAKPDAGNTVLAVSRVPATDRKRRIGVLVVDPGGPGLQGRYTVANLLPPQFRALFDIVGFDRRGSHASVPVVDCGEPGEAVERLREGDALVPRSVDVASVTDGVKKYAGACAKKYGALTGHLGTRAVAADVEAIRKALEEDRLSLLGVSYGTLLGQQYLAAHPDRVRAAVFDGVADPGRTGAAEAVGAVLDLDDAGAVRDKSEKVRRGERIRAALSGFLPWCKGAGPAECAVADDPPAAVDAVFAEAPELVGSVDPAAYDPALWPEFARAVDRARNGGAGATDDLKKLAARTPPKDLADVLKPSPNSLAFDLANKCTDFRWPRDVPVLLDEVEAAAKAAGHEEAAPSVAADFAPCAAWPGGGTPLGALTAPEGPRPLIVNTQKDPRTPLAGAEKVAARLKAPVLEVGGDLHGVTTRGNGCVQAALVRVLVEGSPPRAGHCPA